MSNVTARPAPRAIRAILPIGLLSLSLAACVTSGPDLFLLKELPDRDKANALVAAGAAEYASRLSKAGDIDAVDEVALWFKNALEYDPGNRDAQRYLTLVDDFKAAKLRASLSEAQALLKKPKRAEAEDYALALAVNKALALDASSEEVRAVAKSVAPVKAALVESYLGRARATLAKLDKASASAIRERSYIEAFREVDKASHVDPASAAAKRELSALKSEIGGIVNSRLKLVETMIAQARWAEARGQVGLLRELDSKLDGAFQARVNAVEYHLHYDWARALFAAKDYPQAQSRVDAAIALRSSAEALDLRRRIGAARASLELGAGFDSGLANLDAMLASRDLIGARRVLTGLSSGSLAASQRAALDARRLKLDAAVEAAYQTGVRYYREEKFADCIGELELATAVVPGYKDALDYLEKARAKQRLLSEF